MSKLTASDASPELRRPFPFQYEFPVTEYEDDEKDDELEAGRPGPRRRPRPILERNDESFESKGIVYETLPRVV